MAAKKACESPKPEKDKKNKYICKKCGSKAAKETHLCKPKKK